MGLRTAVDIRILSVARGWLGYLEHSSAKLLGVYSANVGLGGYTIFGEILGCRFQGFPWCATFVFAVFRQAKAEGILGKPWPGCRTLAKRFQKSGRWLGADGTPSPGDIIFLSPKNDGKIGHCGIVESVDETAVTSIDGNTVDPSGRFPPHAGGAVARMVRRRTDGRIIGYGKIY